MTFVSLILGLTLFVGLTLAAELLLGDRVRRPSAKADAAPGAAPSGVGDYEPLGRLFDERDFAYLADAPDLSAALDASRRRSLRLFLRGVRGEFVQIWGLCRTLAPISPDPDFATGLLRQYAEFHWVYAQVLAASYLPSRVRETGLAGDLVGALRRMRDAAETLLSAADPATRAALGAGA